MLKCKAKGKACQGDSCQWPKTDAKLIWGPICQTFSLNCKFQNYRNFSLKYHAVSGKDPSDNQGCNYSGGDETCSIIYTLVDAVYLIHLTVGCWFFFFFLSLPHYLSKFSINFLDKSFMSRCPCYCIKEHQCQEPEKICYQGTGSLQITVTGRNILAVVNKLCQKHIQWNSNMLMVQIQFDIPEQIHAWTSELALGYIELFICYFSHSLV